MYLSNNGVLIAKVRVLGLAFILATVINKKVFKTKASFLIYT